MNLQFIKYFVLLAQEKNFTKAAEKSFVVQSTFSAGIKKLEEALDCRLFYRDKRNVRLSEKGEQLLPRAKELLRLWNTIKVQFQEAPENTLKIGVLNTIHHADAVVPSLKRFKSMYVNYQFELIEKDQEALWEGLRKEQLDIAFIQETSMDQSVYQHKFVYQEKLEVVVPAQHELSGRRSIKLEELNAVPFIEHVNCVLTEEVGKKFSERGLELNKVFSAQHSDMLTSLVGSDLGVSLMAKPKNPNNNVAYVPLEDAEFKRNIFMVWKRENASNALKCFLEVY